MYELKITVTKVLGECRANPPAKPGDSFTVRDGRIRIPEGGYICLWALQNLLPVITPKEREIAEQKADDWLWRVHHVQCSSPEGRVIFKIERLGRISKETEQSAGTGGVDNRVAVERESMGGALGNLRVVVKEVKGKCPVMKPGDYFITCSGKLYIPADRHFCLYALSAVIPFLSGRQPAFDNGDWPKRDNDIICPDPAGNVVMSIEELGD